MYKNQKLLVTDTTEHIWDYLYKIQVPFLQSRSDGELEKYGTYLSGNEDVDTDIGLDMMTTMKSIAQMIVYYKEGVSIGLINVNDSKSIYDAIQRHLEAWSEQLEVGINIGDAPIDDLIIMDEFANNVFDVSKHLYEVGYSDNIIIKKLGFNNRIGPHNFFKSKLGDDSSGNIHINGTKDDKLPNRKSLSNFFKNRVISLR